MAAGRRCLDCPRIGQWKRSRCPEHDRALDRVRGTRQERGYDYPHLRLRATYQARMDRGEVFHCWRCGKTIDPTSWHLGHDDHDRTLYRGPECVPCNTATSSRR